MTYHTLRYIPGTKYGKQFPDWRFGGKRKTYASADASRMQCAHPDQIEVVTVEDDD